MSIRIKPFCLFLIYGLIVQQVYSQTPEIERLFKVAANSSGKDRINAFADICQNFYAVDPHKGIKYGKEALHMADSMKIPSAKSKVYNCIGVNLWAMSDFATARIYYDSAYKNAIVFHDTLQIGLFYNRMGLIYESLGQFDSSLLVFKKELDIYRQFKNDERIGTALENMGTIHMKRGEFKSAIIYLIDAMNIYEKMDKANKLPYLYLKLGNIYSETRDFIIAEKWFQKGIDKSLALNDLHIAGMGLNAIGILYKKQEKYDMALTKFGEAMKAIQSIDNKSLTMAIYDNIGNVYSSQGQFQKALVYHQKSKELALQLKVPLALAINQVNLGNDYEGLKDYSNARIMFEKALPAFINSKSRSHLIITYKALIDVNNALGNYKESVEYYRLYSALRDSLNSSELNSALDSLKVKFNTEQTDRENTILRQETELQSKTILQQRIIMFSSFIVVLLFISLIIVIVRNRRKIKKTNELLAIKNLEISAKANELLQTNNRLVELSNFKDTMNSFLVHDLKNPLNTIININSRQYSEQKVEVIRQSGKRMLNLVMNLLDVSKYENRKMTVQTEATSLLQMIRQASTDVQYLANQRSIRLELDCQTDFTVNADKEIIERVLVNLLTNAIKFSPTGEKVLISTNHTNRPQLKIIIKDHGEGIEPEFLPFIFDKYTSSKQQGYTRSTGIGLTFCKMAIEAHAGKIGVESVVGHGASFWFTIPLADCQSNLQINPVDFKMDSDKFSKLCLPVEELHQIKPYCDLLKLLSISQISDVKDIINSINFPESDHISAWKSELFTALSDCNELKYNELINLHSNEAV